METLIQGFKEGLQGNMEKIASEVPAEQHDEMIEKIAEEFERLIKMNGMEKEAGFGAAFTGEAVGKAGLDIGKSLVGGALMGLGGMAVKKVTDAYGSAGNRRAYETALENAIGRSETLQHADQDKVRRMGDSIYSFAPRVASDANVLANILTNAVYMDNIDLQTIRAVTELEEKLNKMG